MSADIKALRRAVKDAEAKAEDASELARSVRARLDEVQSDESRAHKALDDAKNALKAAEPLAKRKANLLREATAPNGAWIGCMSMRHQRRDDARELRNLGFAFIEDHGTFWRVIATDAGRAKLAETKS